MCDGLLSAPCFLRRIPRTSDVNASALPTKTIRAISTTRMFRRKTGELVTRSYKGSQWFKVCSAVLRRDARRNYISCLTYWAFTFKSIPAFSCSKRRGLKSLIFLCLLFRVACLHSHLFIVEGKRGVLVCVQWSEIASRRGSMCIELGLRNILSSLISLSFISLLKPVLLCGDCFGDLFLRVTDKECSYVRWPEPSNNLCFLRGRELLLYSATTACPTVVFRPAMAFARPLWAEDCCAWPGLRGWGRKRDDSRLLQRILKLHWCLTYSGILGSAYKYVRYVLICWLFFRDIKN